MDKDNQNYKRGSYYNSKSGKNDKSDSDSKEKKPISGSARYLEMLEREQAKKEAFEKLEARRGVELEPEPEPEIEEVEELIDEEGENEPEPEKKKSYASLGMGTAPTATSGDMAVEENQFKKIKLRNVITCAILGVIALIMEACNFRLPLMPVMMRIDMSAIPELIAAVGFGPIAGIVIIIVKNILYVLFMHFLGASVTASAIANVILDSVFVTVSSLLYARNMWSRNAIKNQMILRDTAPEKLRGLPMRMIIKCGLIGTAVTVPMSFITTLYIVYPLVFHKYNMEAQYITNYDSALVSLNHYLPVPFNGIVTNITELWQGVLVYNVPITLAKLVFVTLFVAIIFQPLSRILFYQPHISTD